MEEEPRLRYDQIAEGAERQKQKQQRKPMTTMQLPVYKMAANALCMIVDAVSRVPRKLTRLVDSIIAEATELLKAISMANESRGAERVAYINIAIAECNPLKTYLKILERHGILSGEQNRKTITTLKNIGAQLSGWRESTLHQGYNLV